MKKVLIILPSRYNMLETFLKILVDELSKSTKTTYYFAHLKTKLNVRKLISLCSISIYPIRLYKYFKLLGNHVSLKDKLVNIYVNIDLLTYRKIDIVHSTFSNLIIGNYFIGKIYNAQISIGLRGYDITYFPVSHKNCYTTDFWNHIDIIQINSNDLYQCALKWGANAKTPIFKINAAVNDDFILDVNDIKIRDNFDSGIINLLFIGRLHWKKGLDSLVRLILLSRSNNYKFQLSVIGDGPELEKLTYLIWKYDLQDQIHILGKLNQNEIINNIDKADIIIAPSMQEGCSNVVLESQARGKFCIVSDAEGMNEVIQVDETGFVFKEFDELSVLKLINKYVNFNYQERTEIAIRTIERISENFRRSKQIGEWEYYFNELINV